MVVGLGSEASTFHLLTHAFFKAGLFLCAGSIIHALHHTGEDFDAQDMRLMGGLRKKMPFTFVCYLICSMALMGLPLFSGFLSKDSIISNLLKNYEGATYFEHGLDYYVIGVIICVLIGIILTASYMTRQIWMIFFGEFKNEKVDINSIHEGSWKMKLPIGILAFLSIGSVFSANPLSVEHSWFGNFIGRSFEENHLTGIISTLFALIGITAGYLTRNKVYNEIPTFDNLYQKIFINPTLKLASFLQIFDQKLLDTLVNFLADLQVFIAKIIGWFDAKIIDGIPNGTAYSAGIIGRVTRSTQGGKVQLYVAMAFLGLIGLLLFVILAE